VRQYGFESRDRVFDRCCIDEQFGFEGFDLFHRRHTLRVECEAQPLRVGVVYSDFVFETQYV